MNSIASFFQKKRAKCEIQEDQEKDPKAVEFVDYVDEQPAEITLDDYFAQDEDHQESPSAAEVTFECFMGELQNTVENDSELKANNNCNGESNTKRCKEENSNETENHETDEIIENNVDDATQKESAVIIDNENDCIGEEEESDTLEDTDEDLSEISSVVSSIITSETGDIEDESEKLESSLIVSDDDSVTSRNDVLVKPVLRLEQARSKSEIMKRQKAQNAAKISALDAIEVKQVASKHQATFAFPATAKNETSPPKKRGRKPKQHRTVVGDESDKVQVEVSDDELKSVDDVTRVEEEAEESTPVEPSVRRSSRRCAQAAMQNIRDSYDATWGTILSKHAVEDSPVKKTRRKKAGEDDDEKLKKKGKAPKLFKQRSGVDDELSSEDEIQVTKVDLDPEVKARRDAFLFSGIPDSLRTKQETVAQIHVPEYAPLPTISHVPQLDYSICAKVIEDELNVTKLKLVEEEEKFAADDVQSTAAETNDVSDTLTVEYGSEKEDITLDDGDNKPKNKGCKMNAQVEENLKEDLNEAMVESATDDEAQRSDDNTNDNDSDVIEECASPIVPSRPVAYSQRRRIAILRSDVAFLTQDYDEILAREQVLIAAYKKQKIITDNEHDVQLGSPRSFDLAPLKSIPPYLHRDHFEFFTEHQSLSEANSTAVLREVARRNPTYPVHQKYRQIKAQAASFATPAPDIKLASKKRKLHNVGEPKKRHKGCDDDAEPRRRSRRRSSIDDCVIIGDVTSDEAPNEVAGTSEEAVQWTSKYMPTCSGDVIGNSRAVKRLWSWLHEWKQHSDREIRRLKKQLLRQARRNGRSRVEAKRMLERDLGDVWSDDDSDFDADDASESDDDATGLCNTMLLSGPPGIGKTASVYAAANELGYKVFEVNAANRRGGKEVLAQLQEATQSHQVSKKNLDAMFTTFEQMEKEGKEAMASPKISKKTKAMQNFFKPKQKVVAPVEKKRKTDQLEKKAEAVRNGLELDAVSVVLFDEVDVVFDDDRGLWAAIQTFMASTKRPIILTSNDPYFENRINGRLEHLAMRKPTLEATRIHLQLVSLSEQVRLHPDHAEQLARLSGCDIRRALLALNFWQAGGGDPQPQCTTIQSTASAQQSSQSTAQKASGDEFETIRKSRRRIVDDDEDENVKKSTVIKTNRDLPVCHVGCGATQLGTASCPNTLEKLAQNGGEACLPLIAAFCNTGYDLCHANLISSLPLPAVEQPVSLHYPTQQSTQRRRIQQHSEVFDSEEVCDPPEEEEEEQVASETGEQAAIATDPLLVAAASNFSAFYDSMSFMDAHLRRASEAPANGAKLSPGLSDVEGMDLDSRSGCCEMLALVQQLSLGRLQRRLRKIRDRATSSQLEEGLQLPTDSVRSATRLQEQRSDVEGLANTRSAAVRKFHADVMECGHSLRDVTSDLLPMLRNLAKFEHHRAAKTNPRRFIHYFDAIRLDGGFVRRTDYMDALVTDFSG